MIQKEDYFLFLSRKRGGRVVFKLQTMGYYFLSSSHLEDRIWFRDDEDFVAGMNCAAISAIRSGVFVLAFVLMSNHVHFVLLSSHQKHAKKFFDTFKNIYSRHMHRKYGTRRFLRENICDYQEIATEDERMERVIAYVLMNPVAANICLHPTGYSWGSGNFFFCQRNLHGRPVNSLSEREKLRLLHTRAHFPDRYRVGEEGYILPESFVRSDIVEAIFHTPKRMDYFLRSSSKARLVISAASAPLPSFRDQSLAAMTQDVCMSLFRKTSLGELRPEELDRIVYELKRRSGSDVKQLSRVLGMPSSIISEILSRV